MRYMHTMVRVTDLDASLRVHRDALALAVTRRGDVPAGRSTLVYLAPRGQPESGIELPHNCDPEVYAGGRSFGHVAYAVDDIYAACERLMAHGVTIRRPPRGGYMAFVRSPDGIPVELPQASHVLAPAEPCASMPNVGTW